MSLMSMRRKMASQRTATYVIWALIVVFIAGIVLISVPGKNFPGPKKYVGTTPQETAVIATVNGIDITAGEFDGLFNEFQTKMGQQFNLGNVFQVREKIFEILVQQDLINQAADELKIHVYPWTLNRVLKEMATGELARLRTEARAEAKTQATQKPEAGKTPEKPKTEQEILQQKMQQSLKSPNQITSDNEFVNLYIKSRRDSVDSNSMLDGLTLEVKTRLIGEQQLKSLPVSPLNEDYVKKLNTKEVKASWIYIAAKGNTPEALKAAEQAANKARADVVKSPKDFAQVAEQTDDFFTKRKGGSLDWFKVIPGQFYPLMTEYQIFSLKKGEIGPVFPVSFMGGTGYAFVKVDDMRDRTDVKDLNWEKDKQALIAETRERYLSSFGQSYLEKQSATAKIERKSDELKYYDAQTKGDQTTMAKLLAPLASNASLPHLVQAAFKYELVKTEKDPNKRAALLEEIIPYASSEAPKLQLELGRAYAEAGDTEKALQQFSYVADGTDSSDADQTLHTALKAEYAKLGNADGVKRMDDWLKAHPKPAANAAASGMPQTIAPGN